jgi:ABC-type uncharacterized transport system involved in gliding motility auxiliary subunit
MQTREPVDAPIQIRITQDQINQDVPVTNHLGQLLYLWGTPVTIDAAKLAEHGIATTTLISSSARSWSADFGAGMLTGTQIDPEGKAMEGEQPLMVLAEGEFPDTFSETGPPAWPADAAAGDEENPEEPAGPAAVTPLAPAATRLLLVGCAKMFDDNVLQGAQNALLLLNAVDYLAGSEELLTIRSKQLTARTIRPVSTGEKLLWQVVVVALMPVLFIIFGIMRMTRRRADAQRYRRSLEGRS